MIQRKLVYIFLIIIIVQFIFYNKSKATENINPNEQLKVVLNDNELVEQSLNNEMKIYSESAILMEEKTGKILYEKDIHVRKYPASTTKILTAIIALEKCNLDEKAQASNEAVNIIKSGYSTANIKVGETFTIGELVDVMLIHSANEAANIIAEHISGTTVEFARIMNAKAKEIGCLDSNFVNPNGVHDENHYSTAYDLALIARYCMKNEKFREIVTKMQCELPPTELWQEPRIFKNTNSLLLSDNRYYYPYCIGGKTGFTTPAKNCLISISNKDNFELVSVILHAESTEDALSARYLDTINLFEYGYNNYNIDDILEEYDMIEYNDKKELKDQIIGTFGNKSENINVINNSNINHNWIKIILGILIILLLMSYYIFKILIKIRRKKILYLKEKV